MSYRYFQIYIGVRQILIKICLSEYSFFIIVHKAPNFNMNALFYILNIRNRLGKLGKK